MIKVPLNNCKITFSFDQPFLLINLTPEYDMSYEERITIEPGMRSGKPCIRRMRITVCDVLSYLASGMTYQEIFDDFY